MSITDHNALASPLEKLDIAFAELAFFEEVGDYDKIIETEGRISRLQAQLGDWFPEEGGDDEPMRPEDF